MGIKWNAEGTTHLLQLILDNPVWRNALFSQSMFNQHKQYLVTQAICIEMFGTDPGWKNEMTREGLIEIGADGTIGATSKWTSRAPDPVRKRLYILKEWMKKGRFVEEYHVNPAWTNWGQFPRTERAKLQKQYPYYFQLRELVLTDAPYASLVVPERIDIDSAATGTSSGARSEKRRRSVRDDPGDSDGAIETAGGPADAEASPQVEVTSRPAPKRSRPRNQERDDTLLSRAKSRSHAIADAKPDIGTLETPIDISDSESGHESPSSPVLRLYHVHAVPGAFTRGGHSVADRKVTAGAIGTDTAPVLCGSASPAGHAHYRRTVDPKAETDSNPSACTPETRYPYLPETRRPEVVIFDDGMSKIFEDQIMRTPGDFRLAIDKGRMLNPPAELDTSALGDLTEVFKLDGLYAFHHLFQGYRALVHTAPRKLRHLMTDTEIIVPCGAHVAPWLAEVLKVVVECGGVVLSENSVPTRQVCFMVAVRSPIRPIDIRRRGSSEGCYGYISVLTLLRYIDYLRLRRKRSRRKYTLSTAEKVEFGRAGHWRFVGAFSFHEWFWCHRASSFELLRVGHLMDVLESAMRDRPKNKRSRGVIHAQYLRDPLFGDLGARTIQLAEMLGFAIAQKSCKAPLLPGQTKIFIHGFGGAKKTSTPPKGSIQESLLDFVLRLADLI